MKISAGTSQNAADADFAWLEARGRKIRMRPPMPGEARTAPSGMVGATLAFMVRPDRLARVPIGVESGIDVERLDEAGCHVVLNRLMQDNPGLRQALARVNAGRTR